MITVYSKKNCPQCVSAKNFLQLRNIRFNEVKIDEDTAARDFVLAQGHRSVPQIYHNGKLFVENGYTGLIKLTETEIFKLAGENV